MNNVIRPAELRRIARGVELLDSVDPKWYRKINPRNFDLGDSTHCVLGHVYGHYLDGLRDLASKAIYQPLQSLKFDIPPQVTMANSPRLNGRHYGFETAGGNAAYERMGQTWLAIVRQRKAAAKRAAARRRG